MFAKLITCSCHWVINLCLGQRRTPARWMKKKLRERERQEEEEEERESECKRPTKAEQKKKEKYYSIKSETQWSLYFIFDCSILLSNTKETRRNITDVQLSWLVALNRYSRRWFIYTNLVHKLRISARTTHVFLCFVFKEEISLSLSLPSTDDCFSVL